jgi:putative hemolysin
MKMETPVKKRVDLAEIIKSKSPKLYRLLPGFLLRYLKRVIHEDDINYALEKYKEAIGLDFIDGILWEMGAKVTVINKENIPYSGRFIVASNHPLGGLDGMALMQEVGKVRKDIVFPVNDLLMYLENLKPLFIPINKHGKNIDNKQLFDETFASENMVLYFPAGLCSRKQKGRIMDLEWKSTFIKKAKQFQRPIIPVHINGRNSNFFYNLANLRKRLGIKANVEMLYLVDEMYKQQNKEIIITFGKPVSFEIFNESRKTSEWVKMMKTFVYKLGSDPSAEFRINEGNC